MKKSHIIILLISLILIVTTIVLVKVFHKRNPLEIDVSEISLQVEIERFDNELFNTDKDLFARVSKLNVKYPVFFELYNEYIIRIGPAIENEEISLAYLDKLNMFLSDFAVQEAKNSVDSVFMNLDEQNEILSESFKHYKYYYPDSITPRVIAFIAGFNHSVITYDTIIGIGLDKYLGSDSELYQRLQIPEYASYVMDKKFIPYDCMRAWAEMYFPYNESEENLLNRMVYEGQILYFIDAMFPEADDEDKIAYTPIQIKYCREHERDMWAFMVENKMLFITDYLRIKNYIGSGPFTKDFGNESPPRAGAWIGWQIVRAYMQNNSVSLQELMKTDDYYLILNNSQYDP